LNDRLSELESRARFISIDEDGYFHFDGVRLNDLEEGQQLLRSLRSDDLGRSFCETPQGPVWVEAADAPLVARNLDREGDQFFLQFPYQVREPLQLQTLSLDEWDRFHARSEHSVPIVFSRAAQAEFFRLIDDFDDDSITISGRQLTLPPWLPSVETVRDPQFWNQKFSSTETPHWELGGAHSVLTDFLPRLKINRQRILVLGAGSGDDAVFLARLGHFVTAVDFSDEAIRRCEKKAAGLENLKCIKADALKLPTEMYAQYDLLFEHTLYCAIDPSQRPALVQTYRNALHRDGHLFAVFFVFEKPVGPPYGGSEWEIRQRLKNRFEPLYWMRWRRSVPEHQGAELVVYAKKLEKS